MLTALAGAAAAHRKRATQLLAGTRSGTRDVRRRASRDVAERAHKQCHPLPNIPGDDDYRREMVPVYVRRTLAAARGDGPVHHV